MAYKMFRDEIKDRWRGVDLPIHEAIEVLRAAVFLESEKRQCELIAAHEKSPKNQPPSTELRSAINMCENVSHVAGKIDELCYWLYGLGLLEARGQQSLFGDDET